METLLKKATHGHIACFVNGCRCELCKEASKDYGKEYYKRPYVIAKRLKNNENKKEA